MSRSGMSKGVEIGAVLKGAREGASNAAFRSFRSWFSAKWKNACDVYPDLLLRYDTAFASEENLQRPPATDDDIGNPDVSTDALTDRSLRQLRVCRTLWIQAGNITKNRGPALPGNQLMMKRMSRVFFGFPPTQLEKNSKIGNVFVVYAGVETNCSITFSDNGMDKLTLPVPELGIVATYDQTILKFRRTGARAFRLEVVDASNLLDLTAKSDAIGAAFSLKGGRRWGVF